MKLARILLFNIIVGWSNFLLGAACCGGGFASPSIIAGDDLAQVTGSYGWTEVVVDSVDAQGLWRRGEDHQRIQNFKIEAAHIFLDRWQAGISLPVVQRTYQGQSHSGIGDTSLNLGYEYLPDWTYNPIRPKGLGFLQLTLPTGKSKAESEVGGLDSRGNGYTALGIGTLLTKAIHVWDAFLAFDVHRSFSKKIDRAEYQGELVPGWGGNLGLGVGYNIQDYRLGTSLTWTYEDAVREKGFAVESPGSIERYATAMASLGWMASEDWSGTLSVTDQTLFGSPLNTSLGRGFSFQLQRRWSR